MNTNGHYDVTHHERSGYVRALVCKHCDFFVKPVEFRRGTDRSGQPRYNRARAVMVKHLHRLHRDKLAEGGDSDGAGRIADGQPPA